ncbi:hypothetical protein NEF87_000482 [Candidatus Lokiarchaeum ossiferum]|uniref:Type I restriction enzyme R protein N-terminal domain-containing protein n=1 Tax=Candidatus Lokiarchaeum ossiferum TaxID=2951803 RepID=A0ABY6HP73_9ARCH|nr:hypothetical protein NEF87_000482 [Candidatus Lokiarchaeum sp. B-35]
MKEGDIVLLRLGTDQIHAVGIVVGDYRYNELFADVDGWDIQHVRRVKWIWPNSIYGEKVKKFPTYSAKSGDTTQLLGENSKRKPILDWFNELEISFDEINLSLPPLPEIEIDNRNITLDLIGEFLFDKGVSYQSIENLKQVIDDLQMIAKWYDGDAKLKPSEYETECYLIIPLLRALGWTPQKMKLEYSPPKHRKRIDIALFTYLPRNEENITTIVEAKKKGRSIFRAFNQAKNYADTNVNIKKIIVSDGIRYAVYFKKENKWKLHAYLNLIRFQIDYPIYNCSGTLEALWTMTPEWKEGF